MELLTNPETWVALLTLTVLEIVLGIDNVIFISILVQRLPMADRDRARLVGLGLAMGMRILLLLTISWIAGLTQPLFTIAGHAFSWRDLILIGGGLFLLWKADHRDPRGARGRGGARVEAGPTTTFGAVLVQIVLLDIVFSLDSVLTAVGMVDEVAIMIAAVVIAVGVMLIASGPLASFVHAHPTVKMLALAFLLLIGVTLVADGFGFHIAKGYIYAAMGFSRARRGAEPAGGPSPPSRNAGRAAPDIREGPAGRRARLSVRSPHLALVPRPGHAISRDVPMWSNNIRGSAPRQWPLSDVIEHSSQRGPPEGHLRVPERRSRPPGRCPVR